MKLPAAKKLSIVPPPPSMYPLGSTEAAQQFQQCQQVPDQVRAYSSRQQDESRGWRNQQGVFKERVIVRAHDGIGKKSGLGKEALREGKDR